ncbi:vacuolar transporter chaperone [Apophysomyces ossiformis]|uniref:Vacuolar transporter chaperone n=1 Tax=Apophysomyces ossiformis TaxID=679940 RepID=A0A8H7EL17_9FUNG|nr:vacuolar transporter chaperone [Apophysomyces ossiformis]
MKFGEYLQKHMAAPWRDECVRYDSFKRDLKARQLEHAWNEADETHFIAFFIEELSRVEEFVRQRMQQLHNRCQSYNDMYQPLSSYACLSPYYTSTSCLFDDILTEIHTLCNFLNLNRTGFEKLRKRYKKSTNSQLPSVSQKFDQMMANVSHLREFCQPQSKIYWIHLEDLAKVKSYLESFLSLTTVLDMSMSDVFFDNRNWDVYRGQVQAGAGDDMIWLRWHGPLVFAEYKSQTLRECIELKPEEVKAFAEGRYSIADYMRRANEADSGKSIETILRIQTFIQSRQLNPVLQCTYRRTEFRSLNDSGICLRMDTQLTFAKSGNCPPEHILTGDEAYRVPYAVLAITTTDRETDCHSIWLSHLTTNHLVHEMSPQFSKYVHGASQLLAVPQIQLSNVTANNDDKRSLQSHSASPTVVVEMDQIEPSLKKKKKGNKTVKVEPKAFFANERTFISWLQFCALLLTVALNLLNFGDNISRISGATFILVSAFMSLYALARYQYRGWTLRKQSNARYDDVYGPVILCVLIVMALLVNFYLRFRQQLQSKDDTPLKTGE